MILITIKKRIQIFIGIVSTHLFWINVHRYLVPLRYLKKKRKRERFRKKEEVSSQQRDSKRGEKWRGGEKRKKKKKKILCSFQISRLDFFHSIFIKTREPFLGNALRCFPLQCRGGGARVSRGPYYDKTEVSPVLCSLNETKICLTRVIVVLLSSPRCLSLLSLFPRSSRGALCHVPV